ncbi:MAG: TrkH family potassium uptake protein [Bacteroidales bacterium]
MPNPKTTMRILGILLMVEGFFMWLSVPIALFHGENDALHFVLSGAITALVGFAGYFFTRKANLEVTKRDGYVIVTSGWLFFSLFGTLPFLLTGSIPDFTNAFFETMSGFTTTGATILNNIEELSHGILFWRSLTQWLGGMGIIVLTLVILPMLGIGGMQLFAAEVPGPVPDKLHPRIKDTAKRLWGIYVIYTVAEILLLWAGPMNLFDSVCHGLTTMASGGYSTKQASIGHWDSAYVHYVITVFMFLAGVNFTLSYFGFHFRFKKIWKNEEFRYYLGFIVAFSMVIAVGLYLTSNRGVEESFRTAIFQVVSIITTTGYVTNDYLLWIPGLTMLIFVLMFFGGSAGSTGGGPKIMRIVILIKNSTQELKRLIHPNAVIPVRLNKVAVDNVIVTNVLAFLAFYIVIAVSGIIVMAFLGNDFDTSVGAVVAALGNIGPGIANVGPAASYSEIAVAGKWVLSFLMLVGRLELFTVIVLISPAFWKE